PKHAVLIVHVWGKVKSCTYGRFKQILYTPVTKTRTGKVKKLEKKVANLQKLLERERPQILSVSPNFECKSSLSPEVSHEHSNLSLFSNLTESVR
ncbi:hypothetical protein HK096_003109, partial [Nowakowskiella sp. JEL0078]